MTGSRRSATFCLGLVFFPCFLVGPPALARGGGGAKFELLLGPLGGSRPRPPVGVARVAATGSRRSATFCLGLVFSFLAGPPVRGGGGKSKLGPPRWFASSPARRRRPAR